MSKDKSRLYGPRIQKHFHADDPDACSLTQQHFKDECDVNKIMEKFRKTGVITHVRNVQGHYGDFSVLPSYHEAKNAILAADDMFMSLPAEIRARFDNDAGDFLDFTQNPANKDEMIALGLIPKPVVEAPISSVISKASDDSTSSST